ncbi:hypothetical protein BDW62DRAFT_22378 [Aspergillus aurantiobrunneus]
MFVDVLQSRRSSKAESTLHSESLRGQAQPDSTAAHRRPSHRLPSPILDETYYHINPFDAQVDPTQPTHGSQRHPTGSEPIGPTQPGPGDRIAGEGRDNSQENRTPSTEGESLKDARETEILNLYKEFNKLSAKRVQVRQSRMALSYKRDDEMELRVKFMKHLNSFFATLNHPEAEPLVREYELLQIATEEYLKMENSYRQEEDQLEEQEYMLALSMEGFGGCSTGPMPSIQPYTGPWSPDPDKEESIRETPPLVITYLSCIGRERMLQEHLSELEAEWFTTVERRAQRQQFHMPLDEDSEEFLLTFDEERAKVWKNLNNAQMDVTSLNVICQDHGHHGFDHEDLSSLNLYQYVDQAAIWELEADPLNLPPHEQFVFPGEGEAADDNDFDSSEVNWDPPEMSPRRRFKFLQALQQNPSISSVEYINKWMLHQLRISSMGIWHLHRSPLWQPLREQGWQDRDISQAVLDGWFSDEAALASSSYTPYLNDDDDDEDTVTGHANGRINAKSPSSLPSSPRASAPKLSVRRLSEP